MKVAFFIPCYVRAVAPQVIECSLNLLRHLGVKPEIPQGQTCCGQPMGNAGFESDTKRLKQRTYLRDMRVCPRCPEASFTAGKLSPQSLYP